MERKWSESAAVRWALQAAVEGAVPRVAGMPEHVRRGRDLPRDIVKLRNEPTAGGAGVVSRSKGGRRQDGRDPRVTIGVPAIPSTCTRINRNAPVCTVDTRIVQNEANSAPAGFPASAGPARDVRSQSTPRTDLHQNPPKCTTRPSIVQNEANSRSVDATSAADAQLAPRQLAAIALLFDGRSHSDVGRELKIDRSTLFRWRRSPAFAAEVRRRYEETARSTPQRPATDGWRGAASPEPDWREARGAKGTRGSA